MPGSVIELPRAYGAMRDHINNIPRYHIRFVRLVAIYVFNISPRAYHICWSTTQKPPNQEKKRILAASSVATEQKSGPLCATFWCEIIVHFLRNFKRHTSTYTDGIYDTLAAFGWTSWNFVICQNDIYPYISAWVSVYMGCVGSMKVPGKPFGRMSEL